MKQKPWHDLDRCKIIITNRWHIFPQLCSSLLCTNFRKNSCVPKFCTTLSLRWRIVLTFPFSRKNNIDPPFWNRKQSPIRWLQDTKKIQKKYVASFVLPPFIFFGSVSHLAKGMRKYRVATYFERVEGPPFLFVSSFYLPTYLQRYIGNTYVSNSDEGLTDRAQIGPPP
jgi:hypothetical protein